MVAVEIHHESAILISTCSRVSRPDNGITTLGSHVSQIPKRRNTPIELLLVDKKEDGIELGHVVARLPIGQTST
ncbi:hypothetical protein MY4824_003935 [Beauveria thailandica]